MNGGGPLAAPLRALRHAPVVVDDVGVVPRLGRAVGAVASVGGLDVEEAVRWTRAWLVVWQAVLHARGVIGTVAPWTVAVPLEEVPSLKGDPERRRRGTAIALLQAAGLLAVDQAAQTGTLDESAFVPHRAGLELDWGALCRHVRYEPAPVLAIRALAELVVPPDQPTPVTLRELSERTGYAPKQARVALRRLVDAGVLRVSEAAGMPTRYWFGTGGSQPVASAVERPALQPPVRSPASAGGPDGRVSGVHGAARNEASPPPSVPPPALPPVARPGRPVAVRMTLNGVTFSIGAGLAPHVELGPDGVPHVTFDVPDAE